MRTAEEILDKYEYKPDDTEGCVVPYSEAIKAMKEYAKACLENAAVNGQVERLDLSKQKPTGTYRVTGDLKYAYQVDKSSITSEKNLA
jgi:hypothetical protein